MKTCTFSDFMQTLHPWLNRDYIQKAYSDDKGNFKLFFVDGGQKVFHIDDCTDAQIKNTLEVLKKEGIAVERKKTIKQDTLDTGHK